MLLNARAFSTVLNCAARGLVVDMLRCWRHLCACCGRKEFLNELAGVLMFGLDNAVVLCKVRDKVLSCCCAMMCRNCLLVP